MSTRASSSTPKSTKKKISKKSATPPVEKPTDSVIETSDSREEVVPSEQERAPEPEVVESPQDTPEPAPAKKSRKKRAEPAKVEAPIDEETITPREQDGGLEEKRQEEPQQDSEPAEQEREAEEQVSLPAEREEIVPVSSEISPAPSTLADDSARLKATIGDLIKQYESRRSMDKDALRGLRDIEKIHNRMLRDARKKKKRPVDAQKKPPSGIQKPQVISDELCDFLGIEHGTIISRTEVTKLLTSYIKAHKLQDPENGRYIIPNENLARLLNHPSVKVGYFNIQKFLVHHFPESKKHKEQLARDASEEERVSLGATA